ncbi:MAG: glycosyltransferase [Firmicutes bacterium]|nr:glycosyltransferase [Bacillota bacterium]
MIPEIEYKTCYLDGRLGRAREILRKLIAEHPDCGAFYADLALVYLQQGEIAEARNAAEKARALVVSGNDATPPGEELLSDTSLGNVSSGGSVPARPDILAAIGFVRERIGDHEGALNLYEEAKSAICSTGRRRLWIDHAIERVRKRLSGHEGLEEDKEGQNESRRQHVQAQLRISYFLDPNLGPDALRLVCEHMNRLMARGHKVYAIARVDKLDGLLAEIIRVPAREELYERTPDSDIVVATSWRTAFDAARVHGAVPFYFVLPSPGFEPNGNPGAGGGAGSMTGSAAESADQSSKNLEASFRLPLKLIASSDHVRDVLKTRYNRRAEVVPYGVDSNVEPGAEGRTGGPLAMVPDPGIQEADKIQTVKDRPTRLLVVGSDKDEWTESIYAALRLVIERRQDKVEVVRISPSRRLDFSFHVTKWVENPDSSQLANVFSECDILLTGSLEGISSQAAVTAMAYGLPIILCAGEEKLTSHTDSVEGIRVDVPPFKDNAPEGHAVPAPYLMAPLNDAEAIVRAIETLIDDEELRREIGSKGREFAKVYTWERVIDQLEGLFRASTTDVQLAYPSAAALGVFPAGGAGASGGRPRRRPTLSLCMIVKNEERFLARCLDSVKDVVDEMIIVDTGSTDRTVEIAKSYGAKVYFHEWKNDFAEARNASLEKATGDWILVMDADEVLAPGMYTVIHRLIDTGIRAIYCARISNRKSIEDDQSLFDHFMNRLFPSDPDIRFVGSVHERIISLSNEPLPVRSILDFVIFHIGYQREILAGRRKHARNLAILEQCVRNNPSDPYYHYSLGGTYHAIGKVNLAIDELSEAYRLCKERPDDGMSKAIAVSSLCVLSRIVYSFGGRDLAEHYLREALDISPTNTDVLYSLAEIARMKTEWNTAKDLYIKAINHGNSQFWGLTHDPATAAWKAWLGLGVCQTALGDFEHAHQSFERAASLCPSPAELLGPLVHVRNHLASLHDDILSRSLKSWVDEFIDHTARSASWSLDAAYGGGKSYLQEDDSTNRHQDDLGRLDAYLKAYRAGKLTRANEFHTLAVLLEEAGLLTDAFRVYRDALRLEPTNQMIVDALLRLVGKMRRGLSP